MVELCRDCGAIVHPCYRDVCEDCYGTRLEVLGIRGTPPSYARLQVPRTSGAATPAMSDADIGDALGLSASAVHSARKAMFSRLQTLLKESE